MVHLALTGRGRRRWPELSRTAALRSGVDAGDAPVLPRTNEGDDGVQLVAAMRMVATASCRASWRGRQRRTECGGAPGDPVEHGALDSLHETTEHEA